MNELGCFVLIILLLVAAVLGIGAIGDWIVCNGKTAEIGYPAKFDLVAGCLIQVEDGRWIPLESYYYREN